MSNYINGISIAQFRLKSLRRKKRLQREGFDKSLRKLYLEELALSKQKLNLGYEELDPPVQRGWKRYFVLRPDVSRSKEAKFFQAILDKINTVQYSWKKDFKVKRRQRGKKIYVVREQEPEQLWPCSFKKKKFSNEETKHFDLVMTGQKIGKQFLWLYRFREPWRFKLRTEPNIIRRTKIKDFDLEKRANEINQYFEQNNLRPKIFKVVHGRYQWRLRYYYEGDLPKYANHPLKNRSFTDILNEHFPEDQSQLQKKPSNPEGFFLSRSRLRPFRGSMLRTCSP
jgi:hypothetical protein